MFPGTVGSGGSCLTLIYHDHHAKVLWQIVEPYMYSGMTTEQTEQQTANQC